MSRTTLEDRVETLEIKVSALEELPARMTALEGQILQLREEMRGEFSAVRSEMKTQGSELRAEMKTQGVEIRTELRAEMKAQGDTLRAEIKIQGETLLTAIEQGDEKTRVYMRVLFEKYEADRRLMNEGTPKRAKRR